jgi:hypothetical protein
MRPIGFSTGALAKGDFRRALAMQHDLGATAIELSALRESELPDLTNAIATLALANFQHVSIHAPSRFDTMTEPALADALNGLELPVIVHPNIIRDANAWRPLGARLCLENMDARKSTGRNRDELIHFFEALPDATFCLDLGHARQLDRSMDLARELITAFGERLVQLHVSEVGPGGEHSPIARDSARAFEQIAVSLPAHAAVIIESPLDPAGMLGELELVRAIFG